MWCISSTCYERHGFSSDPVEDGEVDSQGRIADWRQCVRAQLKHAAQLDA